MPPLSPPASTGELADMLGLSRWTVSRVLNGHPGVKAATVARVQEAVRSQRFAPSILGRGLRRGKTDNIGICLPNLEDYFLTTKIMRLQKAIVERGLHPVMQITEGDDEARAIEHFAAMRCAGVILVASRLEAKSPALRLLKAAEIPFVQIDPLFAHAGATVVATDRAFAMRQVLGHLHEMGHRRATVAGIDLSSSYGRQRVTGLQQGCRDRGWNFQKDVMFLRGDAALDDFALGAMLAEKYLAEVRANSSAVIALNDRVAFGLVGGLTKVGMRVSKDVALVGYDNTDLAAHMTPALTSVDPQVERLIDLAIDRLLPQIGGGMPAARQCVVRPKLVIRESTRFQKSARG